ncbi:hypothetical protein ABZ912_25610 [Nonomuraea angiospora]|uniref:hypothetical protein n=1 Tax=Nonomuraea angiospora TaxID=46172 RepID=UPI0033C6553E
MIAAVELLIADTQSAWLDREEFTDVFVYEHEDKDKAVIDWRKAREWFDSGYFGDSNVNNLSRSILEFAIALGEERYFFDVMDNQRRSALAAATARVTAPLIGL